jgi:hypothetical protein
VTEEEARRERQLDLRNVLSTQQGRRFVMRLIEDAGAFEASYSENPLATAFSEGQRAVALSLLSAAKRAARESYLLMRSEADARLLEEPAEEAHEEEDE